MNFFRITVFSALILTIVSCSQSDDLGSLAPASDSTLVNNGNRSAAMRENQSFTNGVAWPQFYTIKIGFMNGTPAQQDTVKKYAAVWDDLINLNFEYVTNPNDAQVRIQFTSSTTSGWSYIGYTDNINRSSVANRATMALFANAGLRGGRDLFAIQTIRHEFGHMLGLVHEQLRADSGIDWINPSTRGGDAILMGAFEDYLSSDYDIYSIMHYSVRANETVDGSTIAGYINGNGELSAEDVAFIQSVYPVDGSAPSATTLATRNP